MKLYKVLHADGTCYHGGFGKWNLPHDGQPGEWMPRIEGELIPCQKGYHLCTGGDLVHWLGEAIYEAEVRGEVLKHDNKIVCREARLLRKIEAWNKRAQHLFAADCAEHVLYLYEREYPNDDRPRKAIEAARKAADGAISIEALRAAATAAHAAAYAAYAADAHAAAASYAAAAAAASAAAVAAVAAYAGDATRRSVSERRWQTYRLMQYLYEETA